MFSKDFFEGRRQDQLEAKGRALEHITKIAQAVFNGQRHVLGVWRLNDDEVVSVEIAADGSLQARRWARRGGWESWAKAATTLVPDEVLTAAASLDAEVNAK